MKYSVEVETDSLVYDTPCSSPAVARQLNWAIEVNNIYCRCVVCECVIILYWTIEVDNI